MKRTTVVLVMLFSFICANAADITPISNAFKAGDATSLAGWMDQEVDMAIPGATQKCSAGEAVTLLNAFFKSNKPSGFSVLHNADRKENGFLVGKLPVAGKEYRVNVTYRTDGNKAIIQSIRIE